MSEKVLHRDDLCFYYQVIKHKIEQSTESD